MARKTKRVVVIADMHSGHKAGLTAPTYQPHYETKDEGELRGESIRRQTFSWYHGKVRELGVPDVLIVNADCIDGRGERTGGTELLTTDLSKQCDIASECIKLWKAKKVVMTYGTAYHAGAGGQDWEDSIAEAVNAVAIKAKLWPLDINGLIFDVKHKIGSSTIPHGRHTAIARERLWNQLWGEHAGQPKAHVLLRSHVHYYNYAGGAGWLGIITPALQAAATKYGGRMCSGTVDFGLIHFDVKPSGDYTWHEHLLVLDQVIQSISV